MSEDQFDNLLKNAPEMPGSLADKIRAQIQHDTQPVNALASPATLTVSFFAIVAAVSLLFAVALKFNGLRVLPGQASVLMLALMAMAAIWGAITVARTMRPASGRLQTWLISGLALVAYEVLVYQFFQSHAMASFVTLGIKCLALGVFCGAVVAVPVWLFVRKGFVVDPVQCGAAIGLIGGLSGNLFLTMHCPLIEAPHALVWHAAVIAVCVTSGALIGRLSR